MGLRTRVLAAFGLGALLLSLVLALLTYSLASSYLQRQRELSTQRQAAVNARLVRASLATAPSAVQQVLEGLETPADSQSVLYRDGHWWATSPEIGQEELPARLRARVLAGVPVRERNEIGGEPHQVIGIPLPAANAAYFEVFTLHELRSTMATLRMSLTASAAVTTMLGLVLGRWASSRALRPLTDVAHTAAAIAAGRLDTRLAAGDDASLQMLTASFNQMVDALVRRIERDARFASEVSHELRSPLTTIVAAMEVLQARRDELPERSRRALDLLAEEVHRFRRLVGDLLEISRSDAGVAELAVGQVRLAELVGRAASAAAGRQVPVKVASAAGELVVSADKRRLERAVANLVDNAQVHGGGVVCVALERIGERARLAVEDAGPGVPPGHRNRIFERFSRGSKAGNRAASDGTGLGLALVWEHVRLHGGDVWVEDRPGGGARFVIDLPVARV